MAASVPGGSAQTVLGRVPLADLGFVLPHEHTGIHLWQVPNRWDYWELSPDDLLVVPELAAYRTAGGGTLVDLTLPGVGRDPARLRRYAQATRPAHRHGHRLVPRVVLPGRGHARSRLGRRAG